MPQLEISCAFLYLLIVISIYNYRVCKVVELGQPSFSHPLLFPPSIPPFISYIYIKEYSAVTKLVKLKDARFS